MREQPFIYEINTWVWLHDLGRKYNRPVQLGNVPASEWDGLQSWGFDAVWLMGVWQRSPLGVQIARAHPDLQAGYRRALPDYSPADVTGSPYCIHNYTVDEHLGGAAALKTAREELSSRGMSLILDFVPNHVALDHPWIEQHPEYFIRDPNGAIANGRDPYFPPWTDVAQLNAFNPQLRSALIATIMTIAHQCDGVRCDMAMLLLNRIFSKTWGGAVGPQPENEFWAEAIPAVKAAFPAFRFIAEVYWDLEWALQQLGFDYCYDKRLYDRFLTDNAASIRAHLQADLSYQNKLIRGIENHDEARAASAFMPSKEQAALAAVATLPGAKLFHEGQFEGRKIKTPVQLGRRADEPVDQGLHDFSLKVLRASNQPAVRQGEWKLIATEGDLLAWTREQGAQRVLIVINGSDHKTQGQFHLPWTDLSNHRWILQDQLSGQDYTREGNELTASGLYVELPPWGIHFFNIHHTT